VTLRNGSWLDYPKDTVDYLLFFISCKFVTITDDIRPSNTSSTNCKFGDKAAYGLYFVFRKEDVPYPNTNWWKECEKVVEVPVLNSSLPSDPRNYDTGWRNGGYGKTLRDGFELTWGQESKPQACSQCEQSSGLCGYIQTGVYVSCLCSGGRVGAPNCTSIAASGKPSLQAFPNLQRGLEVILVPLCLACAMNSNRFRLSWYYPFPPLHRFPFLDLTDKRPFLDACDSIARKLCLAWATCRRVCERTSCFFRFV
jgi:hypothetical protein